MFQDGFLTFPFVGILIGNGTQFLGMGMNEPLGTLFTGNTPRSEFRAPMANQLSKALRPISIS
jgi:hypothetical protein